MRNKTGAKQTSTRSRRSKTSQISTYPTQTEILIQLRVFAVVFSTVSRNVAKPSSLPIYHQQLSRARQLQRLRWRCQRAAAARCTLRNLTVGAVRCSSCSWWYGSRPSGPDVIGRAFISVQQQRPSLRHGNDGRRPMGDDDIPLRERAGEGENAGRRDRSEICGGHHCTRSTEQIECRRRNVVITSSSDTRSASKAECRPRCLVTCDRCDGIFWCAVGLRVSMLVDWPLFESTSRVDCSAESFKQTFTTQINNNAEEACDFIRNRIINVCLNCLSCSTKRSGN